jgi:hypothetical protein
MIATEMTYPSAHDDPRARATKAEVVHSERDFTVMTFQQVFVVIFHQETTVSAVGTLRRELPAFAAQHPAGIALLTIVEPDAPMPTSDAREALADFMNDKRQSILISGVAYEGTGFRAAAVRSVVTGLTVLARQPFPHKVFPTIDDASQWMITNLRGGKAGPTEVRGLIDAISAARAELQETSAEN